MHSRSRFLKRINWFRYLHPSSVWSSHCTCMHKISHGHKIPNVSSNRILNGRCIGWKFRAFKYNGSNSYKASLRSKGKINVQKIATNFGGGGHAAAAGFRITGSLKEVQEKVLKAINQEMKKQ